MSEVLVCILPTSSLGRALEGSHSPRTCPTRGADSWTRLALPGADEALRVCALTERTPSIAPTFISQSTLFKHQPTHNTPLITFPTPHFPFLASVLRILSKMDTHIPDADLMDIDIDLGVDIDPAPLDQPGAFGPSGMQMVNPTKSTYS